ncbi:hypothetical protein FM106_01530 [Brachybacterium faecium]|nr:hypothetical protein FM106_01530 [Brachybacterium faecium]
MKKVKKKALKRIDFRKKKSIIILLVNLKFTQTKLRDKYRCDSF